MRLLGDLRARARELGRAVGDGMIDSGQAAVYLRQLLRGNRAQPSIADVKIELSPERPPVLLLHGYLANRGSVHLLERRLTDRNHVVMTYRLGPLQLGDVRETANLIVQKVDSLIAQTGVQQVDIIAHSMGGLVALDYVKRRGGAPRVRRLVLLGTPVRGTWSAMLGLPTAPLGRASLQLLPSSAFLRELRDSPMPKGPEVVAVAGARDWLAPPRTTRMQGIRHVTVPAGHSGLLVDEGVAAMLADFLEEKPISGTAGPAPQAGGSDPPDVPPDPANV